jgi:hypothetical protein
VYLDRIFIIWKVEVEVWGAPANILFRGTAGSPTVELNSQLDQPFSLNGVGCILSVIQLN